MLLWELRQRESFFKKKTPTAFRRHIAQIRVSNAAGMWGAKEE